MNCKTSGTSPSPVLVTPPFVRFPCHLRLFSSVLTATSCCLFLGHNSRLMISAHLNFCLRSRNKDNNRHSLLSLQCHRLHPSPCQTLVRSRPVQLSHVPRPRYSYKIQFPQVHPLVPSSPTSPTAVLLSSVFQPPDFYPPSLLPFFSSLTSCVTHQPSTRFDDGAPGPFPSFYFFFHALPSASSSHSSFWSSMCQSLHSSPRAGSSPWRSSDTFMETPTQYPTSPTILPIETEDKTMSTSSSWLALHLSPTTANAPDHHPLHLRNRSQCSVRERCLH